MGSKSRAQSCMWGYGRRMCQRASTRRFLTRLFLFRYCDEHAAAHERIWAGSGR